MITGKTLLLAAVLAAAPFTVSVAGAQNARSNTTGSTMQQRERPAVDRNQTDQRDIRDRSLGDRSMRDRDMRDRHTSHHDDRYMRHHGWSRGHHYGWRHCVMRWHHHHHVRVCR